MAPEFFPASNLPCHGSDASRAAGAGCGRYIRALMHLQSSVTFANLEQPKKFKSNRKLNFASDKICKKCTQELISVICGVIKVVSEKITPLKHLTLQQARTGLCATVPWHMGPYWDIKWALDNCCLISVFVNIQRCLKQTNRQYETKIKGSSSGKRLNHSSCSLQNTIKSSPKTFRTAKNFRAPLSARMARPLNWGQSESALQ